MDHFDSIHGPFIKDVHVYRPRKNCLHIIIKKDPGRANQKSQGTAEWNFTKPCTSHFFGLCTYNTKSSEIIIVDAPMLSDNLPSPDNSLWCVVWGRCCCWFKSVQLPFLHAWHVHLSLPLILSDKSNMMNLMFLISTHGLIHTIHCLALFSQLFTSTMMTSLSPYVTYSLNQK